MKKIINRMLFVLIAIYVIFCATVYFFPELFFYNPSKEHANLENIKDEEIKIEEVNYESKDGTKLYGWYVAPKSQKEIIVFLHGNSYNIEKFFYKMLPLLKEGYGVFMGEYRGFGGVKGKIRQKGLDEDAVAGVEYLRAQGWKNNEIIVYGMSLGSRTATNMVYELQQETPFRALILEVPFDSLLNVVKTIVPAPLPFNLIVKDKYDNTQMIKEIKSPILVMGGGKDTLVPVELAKNLYNLAPEPKDMIIYPEAKHHNLFEYKNYQDIINWLDKLK